MENLRLGSNGAVFVKRTASDKKIAQLRKEIKSLEDRIKLLEDMLGVSSEKEQEN